MIDHQAALVIRHMTTNDLDAVLSVERRSYEFPWTPGIFRDCLRAGYLGLVAEEADRILGFGFMSFGAGESHILNLCVAPESRRDGVASSLLSELLKEARELNVSKTFLELRESNRGAYALYKSFGFIEAGVRKGYYPAKQGREDALVLSIAIY